MQTCSLGATLRQGFAEMPRLRFIAPNTQKIGENREVPQSSLKDIHILIVDDDSDVLLTLCELFDSLGFSVHTAGDVFGAFREVEARPIHLVLSDIRMPNSNGVDLLRMLRVRNVDEPKVLFVSGFSDYKIEELYHLGAEGYFPKPFSAETVRSAIRLTLVKRPERWKWMGQTRTLPLLDTQTLGQNDLRFGRGGFFLGLDSPLKIALNSEVEFSLDYRPGLLLSGTGIIRWIRSGSDEGGPQGVGVEILELSDFCRDEVIYDIEKDLPVAFIPMK